MKKYILITIATALLAFSSTAQAEDAASIMNKAHLASYYAANDGKASVHMEIINPDGATRVREFTILRKDVTDGGDQWFYVHFKKPNDVRDMTFLVNKHPDRADDQKSHEIGRAHV